MPRVAASLLALALGLAAALALASCGGGSDAKLLAGNTAQEISENLDSVQQLVDEGECVGAEDAALTVSTQVEAVEGIDPELKQALQKGAERLNEVVDTCEEVATKKPSRKTPTTTESPEDQAKAEKEQEKEEEKAKKETRKRKKRKPERTKKRKQEKARRKKKRPRKSRKRKNRRPKRKPKVPAEKPVAPAGSARRAKPGKANDGGRNPLGAL